MAVQNYEPDTHGRMEWVESTWESFLSELETVDAGQRHDAVL